MAIKKNDRHNENPELDDETSRSSQDLRGKFRFKSLSKNIFQHHQKAVNFEEAKDENNLDTCRKENPVLDDEMSTSSQDFWEKSRFKDLSKVIFWHHQKTLKFTDAKDEKNPDNLQNQNLILAKKTSSSSQDFWQKSRFKDLSKVIFLHQQKTLKLTEAKDENNLDDRENKNPIVNEEISPSSQDFWVNHRYKDLSKIIFLHHQQEVNFTEAKESRETSRFKDVSQRIFVNQKKVRFIELETKIKWPICLKWRRKRTSINI